MFLLILFFVNFFLKSQEGYSKKQLLDLIKGNLADTTLIDAYNELTWPIYSLENPDSSIYYAEKAIELSTKLEDIKRLSVVHRRIGITYINMGKIKNSIEHEEESLRLSEKINYKKGMQLALNNIGVAYLNSELLTKALPYFLKSLAIAEETNNLANAGSMYFNCAILYQRIGEVRKCIAFQHKAKYFSELKRDTNMIILTNCGLSTGYRNLNSIDSAQYFLKVGKKYISNEINSNIKFNYYLNEGLLFMHIGEHQKALNAFINTQSYVTVAIDKITLFINIGDEYNKLNNSTKALEYYNMAQKLSEETKTYNNLSYLSLKMAGIYEEQNNHKKFSELIHRHLNYKDSNDKYVKVQQIQQQQLEFDYERKQIADSLRFEHKERLKDIELEVAAAKLNKEKYFRIMLFAILTAIIIFSIFISNRFVVTNRQKKIIENQKQIVELKNQEILDSINYAKRLQAAILPQLSDIKKHLNLDILYLPKDIIGGDFYFFEKHNEHTFFAVCDCTGHGIPGALMSVVCHHALQKSIKEFELTDPGLILTKTREIVIASLNATQQNIKDGMDCSLIVVNDRTKKTYWAGANNHIWIFNTKEMLEIKADKQPVAFYENAKEFKTNELVVDSGSFVCLFTDGYGDQFGGPKGKKYKNKSIKEFLVTRSQNQVEEQIQLLKDNFHSWKKDLDQVDDVAVALIRF
ncbi:SpoIIE family protein phosphatase [Aurantibacillus circumpalustris]|uniref:SpoIIE family protein phosphatase n=1 Tax=Aurantibacillus circumpalustris TaxID=3036359 RepID=UPI00295B887A|nr:SpoIIE family protein phosphatase [Aurantibacillus circumpalustris]